MLWCNECDGEGYVLTKVRAFPSALRDTCFFPRSNIIAIAGKSIFLLYAHDVDEQIMLQPGEAGVKFRMGMARCKACHGIGVVACPYCGGQEVQLPPPDPDYGPLSRGEAGKDEELSLDDWLARFGSCEGDPAM